MTARGCERGEPPGLVEMSDVFTNQEVLVVHANARLNVHGRRLLVERVLWDRGDLSRTLRRSWVSLGSAHTAGSLASAKAGEAGLADRSSRPHRSPRRTPARGRAARGAAAPRRSDVVRTGSVPSSASRPAPCGRDPASTPGVPRLAECDPLTGEVIRASKGDSASLRTSRTGRPGPHRRQEGRPHPRRWRLERHTVEAEPALGHHPAIGLRLRPCRGRRPHPTGLRRDPPGRNRTHLRRRS